MISKSYIISLQGVGQVICVGKKEVLGHVHELEKTHVSGLRDFPAGLIQLLVQLLPNLFECICFLAKRLNCKNFKEYTGNSNEVHK